MIVVIQALVILFTGAMEGLFRPSLRTRLHAVLARDRRPTPSRVSTAKTES